MQIKVQVENFANTKKRAILKAQQTDDKQHLGATTGYNTICTVLGEGNATTLKAAKKELDDKKVALDKHLISLVAAVDNQLLEVRAAGNCEALDSLKTEVKDTHVTGMKANVIKEFAQTLASFRKSCDQIQTGPGPLVELVMFRRPSCRVCTVSPRV